MMMATFDDQICWFRRLSIFQVQPPHQLLWISAGAESVDVVVGSCLLQSNRWILCSTKCCDMIWTLRVWVWLFTDLRLHWLHNSFDVGGFTLCLWCNLIESYLFGISGDWENLRRPAFNSVGPQFSRQMSRDSFTPTLHHGFAPKHLENGNSWHSQPFVRQPTRNRRGAHGVERDGLLWARLCVVQLENGGVSPSFRVNFGPMANWFNLEGLRFWLCRRQCVDGPKEQLHPPPSRRVNAKAAGYS